MVSNKFFILFLVLVAAFDCAGQTKADIAGGWSGNLKDSSGEFEYKLTLEREDDGFYTGYSTSRNANFYCKSRVKAVESHGRLIVSELEVLNTDYPNKLELCLLSLILMIEGSKLSGKFVPLSKNSNCLSGTVLLNKATTPAVAKKSTSARESVAKTRSLTQKVKVTQDKKLIPTTIISKGDSMSAPLQKASRVENKVRVIDIDADEAELTILDNMAVDGDIVTLLDNDNLIFRKVVLSKIPRTYTITNLQSSIHLIKFYAENLGATPPNTGVLIVKTHNSVTKTNFSSDLNQTATIQINLRKPL